MDQCFLLSLPRSGSTLIERVLAQHPEIHAVGEPWIALLFPYVFRKDGVQAEYSHSSLCAAATHFISQLPEKECDYFRAAGEMIVRLQQKIATEGTRYFLDKTPRYHLILDELTAMFPDAKFIILYRNPLAVAASMIQTGKKGRFRFGSNAMDLYQGPRALVEFAKTHQESVLTLRYEDFVQDPLPEYNRIMRFLGMTEASQIELPRNSSVTDAPLGDKTGVTEYKSITTSSVGKWVKTFNTPIRKRWAKDYLTHLDSELEEMGYSRAQLLDNLRGAPLSLSYLLQDILYLREKVLRMIKPLPIQFIPYRRKGNVKLRFRWK